MKNMDVPFWRWKECSLCGNIEQLEFVSEYQAAIFDHTWECDMCDSVDSMSYEIVWAGAEIPIVEEVCV